MIAAYGQDDRVCAYPSLTALLELQTPARTCVVVLADKEEIGSEGVTGLRSAALKHFLISLCENRGADYKVVFAASDCLSADVGGAYDPCYADAYEAVNSSYMNHGVAVMKSHRRARKVGFVGRFRRAAGQAGVHIQETWDRLADR